VRALALTRSMPMINVCLRVALFAVNRSAAPPEIYCHPKESKEVNGNSSVVCQLVASHGFSRFSHTEVVGNPETYGAPRCRARTRARVTSPCERGQYA
jgi:hypothetical protein